MKEKFNVKYFEYLFFGILLSLLIYKFFLITNTNDSEFLKTYKFMSSDSYDWLANGIRFLEGSEGITLRNPGLPFIIKLLNSLNILPMLGLISQLTFFGIIVYVFKSLKLLVNNRYIAYMIVLLIFLNYNLQLFANYILADYYAICFISASLFYLLNKQYRVSFVLLSVSMLFQNFGYFMLPLWLLGYYIFENKEDTVKDISAGDVNFSVFKPKDILSFIKQKYKSIVILGFLGLLFVLPWHLYKLIIFGNPFFSRVDQFAQLHPDLDSTFFYGINAYSMFGLIFYIVALLSIVKFKLYRKKENLILLLGWAISSFFWMVLYDWNDRRFLVYQMPFLFLLLGVLVNSLTRRSIIVVGMLLLLIYPSALYREKFFEADIVPVTNEIYVRVNNEEDAKDIIDTKLPLKIESFRWEFEDSISKEERFIAYAGYINRTEYYVESESTWYSYYTNILNLGLNMREKELCTSLSESNTNLYLLSSILLINNNLWDDELEINYECTANVF